jgi:hypothetical protein
MDKGSRLSVKVTLLQLGCVFLNLWKISCSDNGRDRKTRMNPNLKCCVQKMTVFKLKRHNDRSDRIWIYMPLQGTFGKNIRKPKWPVCTHCRKTTGDHAQIFSEWRESVRELSWFTDDGLNLTFAINTRSKIVTLNLYGIMFNVIEFYFYLPSFIWCLISVYLADHQVFEKYAKYHKCVTLCNG